MCRANVGVKEGNWFWEARIQTAAGPAEADGPHVRIGWARREGKHKRITFVATLLIPFYYYSVS